MKENYSAIFEMMMCTGMMRMSFGAPFIKKLSADISKH